MISTTRSTSATEIRARTVWTSATWSSTAAAIGERSSSCIVLLPSLGQAPPFRTLSPCSKRRPRRPRVAVLPGRAEHRGVDGDLQRATEQVDQDLYAGRSAELAIEDRVHHRKRPALDDHPLSGLETLAGGRQSARL